VNALLVKVGNLLLLGKKKAYLKVLKRLAASQFPVGKVGILPRDYLNTNHREWRKTVRKDQLRNIRLRVAI